MLWLITLIPLCGLVASLPQSGGSGDQVGSQGGAGLSQDDIDKLTDIFSSFGGNVDPNANAGGGTEDSKDYDYYDEIDSCGHASYACVVFFQCKDGEIITDGAGSIDIRTGPVQVNECANPDYPDLPGICCHIPGTPVTIPPVDACDLGQECVESDSCSNDVIVTDGSGLIDIRSGLKSTCWLNGGAVGVCCLPPLPPLITCPAQSSCVANQDCFGQAYDEYEQFVDYVTGDSYSTCETSNYEYGVCCLSTLPYCPGSSVCVEDFQCAGKALSNALSSTFLDYLTASGAEWERCTLAGYQNGGICCEPYQVLDVCPHSSKCVSPSHCLGNALGRSDSFNPYQPDGSWSECTLAGQANGVCCEPPYVIDQCPDGGKCIAETDCNGNAMDYSNNYNPYASGSSFMPCSLDQYNNGICCKSDKNPPGQCGFSNPKIDTRIVAPQNRSEFQTHFGEIPWQAIIFGKDYAFICGATLISNKFLLTAAHCVDGNVYAHDLNIRLGEWQVNTFDEPKPYKDVPVQTITLHPEFNPSNVHNDIAVIELKNPVDFDYHINPVCLPSQGALPAKGQRCIASGWGKDAFEKGNYQHSLKKVDLPFVPFRKCQRLLRKTRLTRYFKLHRSFTCAGGEYLKDVCEGDGGGPLACLNPHTQSYELVGITSWGIGCGVEKIPGVYASVPYFADWISGITGGSGPNYG